MECLPTITWLTAAGCQPVVHGRPHFYQATDRPPFLCSSVHLPQVCNHFTEVWPQWQKGQTHPVTAPSLSAPVVLPATCFSLQESGFYSVPQSGTKPRHSPPTARWSQVEVIAEPGAGNPKPGQFNSLQVLGHFCHGNPPPPIPQMFSSATLFLELLLAGETGLI